mmetsp:Transcript_4962/g.16658  ORF Transcript_4962/g.16658 Transcript_4962/m.16658 type:complete len:286 (+) Transcript_4962:151-1008(+)
MALSAVGKLPALLLYVYVLVRTCVQVAWVRLQKLLLQPDYLQPPETPRSHKVVVVGDGLAEGLGDWVTLLSSVGGISTRLEALLRRDPQVRTRWRVLNRGRNASTSRDWLPGRGASLLDATLSSRGGRDASVVVVALGSEDVVRGEHNLPVSALSKDAPYAEEDLAETVRNVRSVCEHLRARGVRVALCDLPTEGAVIGRRRGHVRRMNRQLKQYAASTAGGANPVLLVRVSDFKVQGASNRAFDGVHLNSGGYKALAGLVMEAVKPHALAVEWNMWKQRLTSCS